MCVCVCVCVCILIGVGVGRLEWRSWVLKRGEREGDSKQNLTLVTTSKTMG